MRSSDGAGAVSADDGDDSRQQRRIGCAAKKRQLGSSDQAVIPEVEKNNYAAASVCDPAVDTQTQKKDNSTRLSGAIAPTPMPSTMVMSAAVQPLPSVPKVANVSQPLNYLLVTITVEG